MGNAQEAALSAFYRFYLLQDDDHIARRREDYFADDAAAIAAARCVIGDYPGVEIWCEQRKVVTLSLQDVARLQPPVAHRTEHRAALLINRNRHLLQEAAQACRRAEVLRARLTAGGSCARANLPSRGAGRRQRPSMADVSDHGART